MTNKNTIKVSVRNNRAAIDSNSFNEKGQTIEAVFATETPVPRINFFSDTRYNEVLEISDKAVDLSRSERNCDIRIRNLVQQKKRDFRFLKRLATPYGYAFIIRDGR